MVDKTRFRIMFLCTGNASRSQMAEALARLDHGEMFDVVSSGSRPWGKVHPYAYKAMDELGADMSAAWSKAAADFLSEEFDVVVTLCDSAAVDCPSWPGAKRVVHWSIKDPSFGDDDPATRYDRFLLTRDELRRRIGQLADDLRGSSPER